MRFGFNGFSYTHNGYENDGITYDGKLTLRSAEILFDQYLGGGFHISPEFLFYNGNKVDATGRVPGGGRFTLNDVAYVGDAANPVNGTGKLSFRKASPMILMGFGNLLPRSNRHFSVSFEFGVVFQGSPNAALNLNGKACTSAGQNCLDVATTSTIQANVRAEQDKINKDLVAFKYYPVISLGFGWKF